MIVAQITDMHIKQRGHILHHMPHVARPLRRVLSLIAGLPKPPDCIVATGDLTENGTPAEYERLRTILSSSQIPVYLLSGNHDRREPLRGAFPDHQYLCESEYGVLFTIEMARLRVVALDSSDEGHNGGSLDEARLAWLARRLQERRGTPTILAMHHPPFPTGVKNFDRQRFEGRDELARIVHANPQIARVICGHVHQPLAQSWCGTLAVTAPSTAPTLTLHPRLPGLRWEPGGFLLHRYDLGAGVTTTLIRAVTEPVSLIA